MIRTKDEELAGVANVYEDITEMAELAVKHGNDHATAPYNGNWIGREDFSTWADVARAMHEPWSDGLFEVRNMLDEIAREVPPPRSIKRQRFWSQQSGDVNPQKALAGNPLFRSEVRRSPRTHVPQNATVICNVGNIGSWTYQEIFWRGAAGIAAVDLLEKAGYSCEIWVYNLADSVFHSPASCSLCACRVKASGDVLDIDTVVSATSAWFFRTVIFELRKADPDYAGSKHGPVRGSSHDRLGGWNKYFDIENGVTPVYMPAVRTREAAIVAARSMIEKVTGGEGDLI